MSDTTWQTGQKRRAARVLSKVDGWPDPLRRMVGARLISLTAAIEVLDSKPRQGSNHSVISDALGALEDAVDRMVVTELEEQTV